MSDDDRIDDIESDLDNCDNGFQADKRAHHNALERKRRDHIKDSFSSLKEAIPAFQGEKVRASRAQILKKAADYISAMRRKNCSHTQDIDDLKRQNKMLEETIRSLEKAKASGNLSAANAIIENSNVMNTKGSTITVYEVDSSESEISSGSVSDEPKDGRRKKLKVAS